MSPKAKTFAAGVAVGVIAHYMLMSMQSRKSAG